MGFWFITGLMALMVLSLFLAALLRNYATTTARDPDLQVYRQQLKSLEKDVQRGVIAAEEAETARVEISRRILDADHNTAHLATAIAPKRLTYVAAAVTTLILLGGSFYGYSRLGATGYPDMPFHSRLTAAENLRNDRPTQLEAQSVGPAQNPNADPAHVALVEKLRTAVGDRPDDLRGLALLASNEAAIGNFIGAHEAQAKVIALRGEAASASDYTQYADFLIVATGGYVSPAAEKALTQALSLDDQQPTARYYSGLMFAQIGRPDLAFRLWRDLLETSPSDAPWVDPIRGQILDLAQMAGENYQLPAGSATPGSALPGPALPGPDADTLAAAQDMSAQDRDAMIRNMVEGLADRLAAGGGSVQEWTRLIGAYGVLDEAEKARAAYTQAQGVFAGQQDALLALKAVAQSAGIAE